MPRFACGVEYDGSAFRGWQRQRGAPSVQEELERALSRVADHPVTAVAAGRTDAGVHAAGQVVHFDSPAARSPRAWQRGAGSHLPPAVSLSWARPAAAGFHARHAATRRHYRYIFLLRPDAGAGLLAGRVTRVSGPLDAARMARAARPLLGEHDFSSFRAAACQAQSPVRALHRLDVAARGPFVHLDLEANGFLHHMARILAGALLAVGRGERGEDWPAELLARRDRAAGGVTAPPDGLYLMRVHYPPEHGIPPPPWRPDYRYDAPLTCESE